MTKLHGAAVRRHVAAVVIGRSLTGLIMHHTATRARAYRGQATVAAIRRYHMTARGWSDIGYHYLVAPDGVVWVGRPLRLMGAHTKGHNQGTAGVALVMHGEHEPPSADQAAACGELLAALLRRTGLTVTAITLHREHGATVCPGRHVTRALVRGWAAEALE